MVPVKLSIFSGIHIYLKDMRIQPHQKLVTREKQDMVEVDYPKTNLNSVPKCVQEVISDLVEVVSSKFSSKAFTPVLDSDDPQTSTLIADTEVSFENTEMREKNRMLKDSLKVSTVKHLENASEAVRVEPDAAKVVRHRINPKVVAKYVQKSNAAISSEADASKLPPFVKSDVTHQGVSKADTKFTPEKTLEITQSSAIKRNQCTKIVWHNL